MSRPPNRRLHLVEKQAEFEAYQQIGRAVCALLSHTPAYDPDRQAVWLLNRFNGCWRWLLDRSYSPWYPTLRQFRQPRPGDWENAIAEITRALAVECVGVQPAAMMAAE